MKNKEQLYDEILILKVLDGDTSAFTELIRRWAPKIFYYVKRLITRESDVEDVMQEIWLSLYRSLGHIKDISQYRVLLFSIARSRAIDHLRREGRRARWEIPVDLGEFDSVAFSQEVFADMQELHAALNLLDTPIRDILTLFYLRELSIEEIAHVMKLPKGTVKSRLHYARKALRRKMESSHE